MHFMNYDYIFVLVQKKEKNYNLTEQNGEK